MSLFAQPITVNLFVPLTQTDIRPRSAVVGTRQDGLIVIDFESGRPGTNIVTYEDRVIHAAGRHVTRYPTTARMALKPEDLQQVGTARYSPALQSWYIAELTDEASLAAWIAPDPLPRIGGSVEIWRRAASLYVSKNRRIMVDAKTQGSSAIDLAIQGLITADRGLVDLPSSSEIMAG